jgi:hypothetical protein
VRSYQQQRYIDISYLCFYVLVLLNRVYASRVLNYKLPAFLSVVFFYRSLSFSLLCILFYLFDSFLVFFIFHISQFTNVHPQL